MTGAGPARISKIEDINNYIRRPCGWPTTERSHLPKWQSAGTASGSSGLRCARPASDPGSCNFPKWGATMSDAETTITELMGLVRAFSRERDWEQFHHPKDLGVALACE